MRYLELDESYGLRRLSLNSCAVTGELATGIFCRTSAGRDIHVSLNANPLEAGSTDWIDLIHGNETPTKLDLDMIQFQHESNFDNLLNALACNKTIEFLSMVGTGPPGRVTSKTYDLLSNFLEVNDSLKFLDISGYSGKLEDGHLGWGLSGALRGLKKNTTLRQLRLRNHDMGGAEDLTELCQILAANKGLAMLDIQHNNIDQHQFGQLIEALSHNHQIISFPISAADRESAVTKEKRAFVKLNRRPTVKVPDRLTKSAENRLDGVLTGLYEQWVSEAQMAKHILERNRHDPANQSLELECEYLEAWDDDDLPLWLTLKAAQPNQGKRRASEPTITTPTGDTSPITSTPVDLPTTGLQGSLPRRSSCPLRKTYVIQEEA